MLDRTLTTPNIIVDIIRVIALDKDSTYLNSIYIE